MWKVRDLHLHINRGGEKVNRREKLEAQGLKRRIIRKRNRFSFNPVFLSNESFTDPQAVKWSNLKQSSPLDQPHLAPQPIPETSRPFELTGILSPSLDYNLQVVASLQPDSFALGFQVVLSSCSNLLYFRSPFSIVRGEESSICLRAPVLQHAGQAQPS